MNNQDKRSNTPNVPVPVSAIPGNLLSSVAPPTELPNFITAPNTAPNVGQNVVPSCSLSPGPSVSLQPPKQKRIEESTETVDKFSPAIPLSKGEPTLPIRSPEDSQTTTQSPVSLPESTPEMERIGDPMPGSGIITWVKGAVASGGIFHRVAEKARSSVDSMITTLDPQMKEYLNSGGDMYIVVASEKDIKVSPVREAFQSVFGKATVVGYPAQSDVTAIQPVGCPAAYAAAKQRMAQLRSTHTDLHNNVPIVAVENYLYEAMADRWYDVSLLLLCHPSLGIELQVLSQSTPVPAPAIAALQAATSADYPHKETGFSTTIGSMMAANLQVEIFYITFSTTRLISSGQVSRKHTIPHTLFTF
ncbi:Protein PRRC1 [Eumeta japonica]|uniref:Protein PRRC1 n=1 Tax=Eumeta variegata TaxID=151549 RepID=A0A4C1ZTR4_EUMVA|nr:Protein PRRC1 [Eumeta japonica]